MLVRADDDEGREVVEGEAEGGLYRLFGRSSRFKVDGADGVMVCWWKNRRRWNRFAVSSSSIIIIIINIRSPARSFLVWPKS
jgi:hypothetical protein